MHCFVLPSLSSGNAVSHSIRTVDNVLGAMVLLSFGRSVPVTSMNETEALDGAIIICLAKCTDVGTAPCCFLPAHSGRTLANRKVPRSILGSALQCLWFTPTVGVVLQPGRTLCQPCDRCVQSSVGQHSPWWTFVRHAAVHLLSLRTPGQHWSALTPTHRCNVTLAVGKLKHIQ